MEKSRAVRLTNMGKSYQILRINIFRTTYTITHVHTYNTFNASNTDITKAYTDSHPSPLILTLTTTD